MFVVLALFCLWKFNMIKLLKIFIWTSFIFYPFALSLSLFLVLHTLPPLPHSTFPSSLILHSLLLLSILPSSSLTEHSPPLSKFSFPLLSFYISSPHDTSSVLHYFSTFFHSTFPSLLSLAFPLFHFYSFSPLCFTSCHFFITLLTSPSYVSQHNFFPPHSLLQSTYSFVYLLFVNCCWQISSFPLIYKYLFISFSAGYDQQYLWIGHAINWMKLKYTG